MRVFLVLTLLLCGQVFAATGDIACYAEQYETLASGLDNYFKQDLRPNDSASGRVTLSTVINGRAYTFNGDPAGNDFLIGQSWGENFTSGIITRASFNIDGVLTLTQVEQNAIHRLVCTKE